MTSFVSYAFDARGMCVCGGGGGGSPPLLERRRWEKGPVPGASWRPRQTWPCTASRPGATARRTRGRVCRGPGECISYGTAGQASPGPPSRTPEASRAPSDWPPNPNPNPPLRRGVIPSKRGAFGRSPRWSVHPARALVRRGTQRGPLAPVRFGGKGAKMITL